MESATGEGWRGATLVAMGCDGSLLGNATLPKGSIHQESICLPAQLLVEVRTTAMEVLAAAPGSAGGAGTVLAALQDISWSLAADGKVFLSGGAPAKASLCQDADYAMPHTPLELLAEFKPGVPAWLQAGYQSLAQLWNQ